MYVIIWSTKTKYEAKTHLSTLHIAKQNVDYNHRKQDTDGQRYKLIMFYRLGTARRHKGHNEQNVTKVTL